MRIKILIALVLLLVSADAAFAQTTGFTYQGKLVDGAMPANANYDFEFRLFAVVTGGAALATNTRPNVSVSNGIFTVQLDFGSQFSGASRWLEIAVKAAGGATLTTLNPRQPVSSSPYAVRSLDATKADTSTNSLQLGGVAASQYVLTADSRMTDARNPLPGSQNYIRNTGIIQNGDFNIDGDGVAYLFDAREQFNINGNRVLGIGGSASTFAGIGAGTNSTGDSNSFFGQGAGGGLTNSGSSNSFFGERSGALNTTGFGNSFFGSAAGVNNSSGRTNSFFGSQTGQSNTTGVDNSYFGVQAGFTNTSGSDNSFFGRGTGLVNTASDNSFFGSFAGAANTNATFNSFFGHRSGNSNTTGISNSFFGWGAGRGNVDGCCNTLMGVLAGQFNTSGTRNVFIGHETGQMNTTGSNNTLIGFSAGVGANNLTFATAIGAQADVSTSNTIALGRTSGSDRVLVYGLLDLETLGTTGTTSLCRNPSGQIATCSSSLRYKNNVQTFTGGLDLVRRLRPITFNWKEGGLRDVGFAAEEVEQVEPLLTTGNDKGEIEGVKYGQITTVLVNAVQQQQRLIEQQQKQIDEQRRQIESLRKDICQARPHAELCK